MLALTQVNIENFVHRTKHLPHLIACVAELRALLSEPSHGSPGMVLWYDACDSSGERCHHSALNPAHLPFFAVCSSCGCSSCALRVLPIRVPFPLILLCPSTKPTPPLLDLAPLSPSQNSSGIFLDYHWTAPTATQPRNRDMPAETRSYLSAAREASRALVHVPSTAPQAPPAPALRAEDVYLGVDVHGRGTHGGGGFNSHVALSAARRAGLSAALFAPAWVFENGDRAAWRERDRHLWRENYQACAAGSKRALSSLAAQLLTRGRVQVAAAAGDACAALLLGVQPRQWRVAAPGRRARERPPLVLPRAAARAAVLRGEHAGGGQRAHHGPTPAVPALRPRTRRAEG